MIIITFIFSLAIHIQTGNLIHSSQQPEKNLPLDAFVNRLPFRGGDKTRQRTAAATAVLK